MEMELGKNRLGNFSLQVRRLFVGFACVPCIVTVANHYFEWELFGRFERYSIGISFILAFLVLRYLGPTMQEMREYRDKKDREKKIPSAGFRPWIYCATILFAMLVFVLIGPVLKFAKGIPVHQGDWIELFIIETLVVVAGFVGWGPTKRLLNRETNRSNLS